MLLGPGRVGTMQHVVQEIVELRSLCEPWQEGYLASLGMHRLLTSWPLHLCKIAFPDIIKQTIEQNSWEKIFKDRKSKFLVMQSKQLYSFFSTKKPPLNLYYSFPNFLLQLLMDYIIKKTPYAFACDMQLKRDQIRLDQII